VRSACGLNHPNVFVGRTLVDEPRECGVLVALSAVRDAAPDVHGVDDDHVEVISLG